MTIQESTLSPTEVWEAVLGELEVQVPRPSYDTWLKHTVGLTYDDGQLVIGTPNTFVAEMLDQRMYSLISQALESVVPDKVDIRFEVASPANVVHSRTAGQDTPTTGQTPNPTVSHRSPSHQSTLPPLLAYGGINLNPKYTFDTFIIGKSNELAHAAAVAVSEHPGIIYNPLFLYSGVGLGKTHLLHAIGHHIRTTGLSVIYSTTEDFTNEYIKAIRAGKTDGFRSRYRSADALLLDDIQFIIGKEQTQEGFFHTFNSLHMAGRQIVITSDRRVTDLTLLEDRVRSRLAGGLVVDIQTPDLETRMAILRAKAEDSSCDFPQDVLEFLSRRVHKNVRELEGCLNRVAAFARLTKQPIGVPLVKSALADSPDSYNTRRISDELVLDTVSAYFSIDKATLKGRRRDKITALARHIAMYLLREEVNLPLTTIGRILGDKDHTTVLHGHRRIAAQLDVDAHLRHDVINIREALTSS